MIINSKFVYGPIAQPGRAHGSYFLERPWGRGFETAFLLMQMLETKGF